MGDSQVNELAASANARGLAALRSGDFATAIDCHRVAAEADPESGALQRNLATACRAAGDDEGEIAALKAAIALDARDFIAWLRTAQLRTRRGEESQALSAWHAVIQMSQAIGELPPLLAEEVAQGQRVIAGIQATLTQGMETRVSSRLEMLQGRDARRARAFLDAATGKRQIFNDRCSGLHYPFLPADEFFDDDLFPWFDQLAAQADKIRAEAVHVLANCRHLFRPYVQMPKGGHAGPWAVLDGKLDWSACFLWEYGTRNEALAEHCPATFAALDAVPMARIPNRAPTAFFSVLKPGKVIPPHTGVTNTRAIIHLPLVVPPKCGFRVGGEEREWIEGKPFAFSDTIDHEAWNHGEEDRILLIFDAWNPHLSQVEQDAIIEFCDVADSLGLSPQEHDIGR
ncbi:aspartyl/asparaginyl beta-hydroxylase domain-containing protein [Novosphingobium aerophilum]|uniref:aspartyl/asparaginyl beta-hydroxylase domain-containing protein n=1 Tax=Novosphingobium TaxID=165696 RepID=UPI002D787E07|nr:aspartyl/asparaginyl beta-hydroxylase domain-containing protein [Novosphingobium sp. RL4]WRT92306.1 aspartyl/asparaginyl beta-hydroxylase domain-containing protein [Novosphingobium sp. RL4]